MLRFFLDLGVLGFFIADGGGEHKSWGKEGGGLLKEGLLLAWGERYRRSACFELFRLAGLNGFSNSGETKISSWSKGVSEEKG